MDEIHVFLEIIKQHIWCEKSEKVGVEAVDWEQIYKLSKINNLEGIIWYQIKDSISQIGILNEISQAFQSAYASTINSYVQRKKLLDNIEDELIDQAVPYVLIKGAAIARLYPVPALRTMGDSDIVVLSSDLSKVHEIMHSLGFTGSLDKLYEHAYFKKDLEFEIHHHLLYPGSNNKQIYIDYAETFPDHIIKSDDGYEFDAEFHFVFLLLHMCRHFNHDGIGIRSFVDLAIYIKKYFNILDWDKIVNDLKGIHLLEYARICMTLVCRWFGISSPISNADISYKNECLMMRRIVNGGLNGFNDDSTDINYATYEIINSKQKKVFAMIKHIVSTVFPSYKTLKMDKRYGFIKDKPYLLPIAWGKRIKVSLEKSRIKHTGNVIYGWKRISDNVEKRTEYLKLWGLGQ